MLYNLRSIYDEVGLVVSYRENNCFYAYVLYDVMDWEMSSIVLGVMVFIFHLKISW